MSILVSPTSVLAGKAVTIAAKGFKPHESVMVWDYTGKHYRLSEQLGDGTVSAHGTLTALHTTSSITSVTERRQRVCLEGKVSHRIVCGRFTVKLTATEATLPEDEAECPEEEGTLGNEVGATPPCEGKEAEGKEGEGKEGKETPAEKKKAEEKRKLEEKEEAEEEAEELKGVSGHAAAAAKSASVAHATDSGKIHFQGQTSPETGFSAVLGTTTGISLAVAYPPETTCEGNVSYLIGQTVYASDIPTKGGRFSRTITGISSFSFVAGYYDSYIYTLSGRVRGHLLTGTLTRRDTIYGPTAGALLGVCSIDLTFRARGR